MQRSDGEPLAAFSVNVSILNEGTAPLEVIDLLLMADTGEETTFYEPIVLWDLKEWIESGNAPDKVGRTQKGQVPLPVLIPADEFFDYGYPALFLPVDHEKIIEPRNTSEVRLELYALTDRSSEYEMVGKQIMDEEDLKPLLEKSFSGAVSTVSKSNRSELVDRLER